MASEANTKRAEELLPCEVPAHCAALKDAGHLGDRHHPVYCPAARRESVATALEAAEQRGREEERERWRKPFETGSREFSPAALAWLREYAGSIDSVALLMAFEAGEAELRRLRERMELMATHHEKSVTAYVAVQPRGEHRAIARAFRELLAEHDAKAEEG